MKALMHAFSLLPAQLTAPAVESKADGQLHDEAAVRARVAAGLQT